MYDLAQYKVNWTVPSVFSLRIAFLLQDRSPAFGS